MLKSTVLVTGGTGLVGRSLSTLQSKYRDLIFIFLSSLDGDLRDIEVCRKLFKQHDPDYVIHLAANVGGLFKNMSKNVEMFEDNLLMNLNVVKVCYEFSIVRLISCLSTCVFPDSAKCPMSEKDLHRGPPHFSNEGYSYAKRMLEVHCRMYNEQYGCNFINVVPTNIYGPYDNFSIEDGHVIPSLIHKCYNAKNENTDFIVKGSGKPLRQFIYSVDLAELIMKIMLEYTEKDTIILAPNKEDEVSIGDVSKCIARNFNYSKLKFDKKFADGKYQKTVNNKKLLDFVKDYKFTPLEQGIKKTVEWFDKNYDYTRR